MAIEKNPRKNAEGYDDPTAYLGMRDAIAEENALEHEVTTLIKVLKFIISKSGFELVGRIQIKDKKTGRIFR